MRGRWASNTFGLFFALAAVALSGVVLAWAAPGVFHFAITTASADEGEGDGIGMRTAPVELAMAQVRQMDTKTGDLNAFSALNRSLCGSLPTDSIISESLVTGDGGRTQTIVMAMPPGTGTWVASEIAASFPQCMGSTTIVDEPDWAPVHSAASNVGNSETVVWSRGDFVMISSGDFDDAREVNDAVEDALIGNRCLDLYPAIEDRYNNLVVSKDDYRAPVNEREVSIDPIIPLDEDENELTQPTAEDIPDPGAEVVVPEVPQGREYWPELPNAVDFPVVVEPLDQPDDSTVIEVPAYDPDGPGCGWVFFSYVEVGTEAATQSQEDAMIAETKGTLTETWEEWGKTIVDFWDARDGYQDDVDEYDEYRQEVASVEDYWTNVVAPLWDEYDRLVDERNAALALRNQWQADFDAAQEDWDEFIDVCVARPTSDETEEETLPGPSPAPTVSPQPSPSPTEEPIYCDTRTMPEILNSEAPEVPDEPVRPTPPDDSGDEQN